MNFWLISHIFRLMSTHILQMPTYIINKHVVMNFELNCKHLLYSILLPLRIISMNATPFGVFCIPHRKAIARPNLNWVNAISTASWDSTVIHKKPNYGLALLPTKAMQKHNSNLKKCHCHLEENVMFGRLKALTNWLYKQIIRLSLKNAA